MDEPLEEEKEFVSLRLLAGTVELEDQTRVDAIPRHACEPGEHLNNVRVYLNDMKPRALPGVALPRLSCTPVCAFLPADPILTLPGVALHGGIIRTLALPANIAMSRRVRRSF